MSLNLYGTAIDYLSPFNEWILVIRRPAAISTINGRVQGNSGQKPVTFRYKVQAIVVPSNPNDVVRAPEYETVHRTIEISTRFSLQAPSENVLADQVIWHGTTYGVISLGEYSKYGNGFVMATCQALDIPAPAELETTPATAEQALHHA